MTHLVHLRICSFMHLSTIDSSILGAGESSAVLCCVVLSIVIFSVSGERVVGFYRRATWSHSGRQIGLTDCENAQTMNHQRLRRDSL